MQHGLSTSRLSSQVRPPPSLQPCRFLETGGVVFVSERPLVFTNMTELPFTITPTSSHTAVTINMLQVIDHLLNLYSSIIQTSFIL